MIRRTENKIACFICLFLIFSGCGEVGEPLPEKEIEQQSQDQTTIIEKYIEADEKPSEIQLKSKFRLRYGTEDPLAVNLGLTKKEPNPACPKPTGLNLGGNHKKPKMEECPPLACKEASFEMLNKCVLEANQKIESGEIAEIAAASYVDQCLKGEIQAENTFEADAPFIPCVKEVKQKLVLGEIDLDQADLALLSCLADQNAFCKYDNEIGFYRPGSSCIEKIEGMQLEQETAKASVLNACLQESKITNCKVFDVEKAE